MKLFEHKKAVPKAVGGSAPVAEGGLNLADIASVVAEFESSLLRYAERILGFGSAERDDIVQETFIRLYSSVAQNGAESIENPASWLFKVARNLCMDHLRRISLHRQAQESMEAEDQGPAGPLDMVEKMIIQEESKAALEELGRLPKEEREVLELRLLKDFKLREISHITGESISMASYRLNQGLATLRNRLKERGII